MRHRGHLSARWYSCRRISPSTWSRERFNMLIGTIFLAVVLFSPDGLLGLWQRLRTHFSARHL
jgi:hypothetical protein